MAVCGPTVEEAAGSYQGYYIIQFNFETGRENTALF